MFDSENAGAPDVPHVGPGHPEMATGGWREIHKTLQRIAAKRARLDADELTWLARAERAQIHRHLGYATILEYVERVLGYGPKVGKERLRVARKLETLPALATELAAGRLAYSAVRELSRIATPATEAAWIDNTRGRCLREIEAQVAGRASGDRPTDPVDPDLRMRTVSLELTPATVALLRDATRRIEDELGHPLSDDALIATMCSAVLAPATSPVDDDSAGRAPYQIALTICERCDRGWHEAAGRSIEVAPSTVEQARCNAQHLGPLDAAAPDRATQDIPPAVQRLVLRRNRGRCCVPGCRSTRFLQIHHIRPRQGGGGHEPSNLTAACFAHHHAAHDGKLTISGTAPDGLVFAWAPVGPQRTPPPPAGDDPFELTQDALVQLGFRAHEVQGAMARVRPHVGPLTVEALIQRTLRELAPTSR